MLSKREALQKSITALSVSYSKEEAKSICDLLFLHCFQLSSKDILLYGEEEFVYTDKLEEYTKRLLKMEPVQYIIGFEEFFGLRILVGPEVLIPRPETEELLQFVCDDVGNELASLADICCGSGCIALGMKKKFPNAEIIGLDISNAALRLAKKSESFNFDSQSIQWMQSDVRQDDWAYSIPQIIICNPPYIQMPESATMESNVLQFEPHLALFVNDKDPLLFYKKVIRIFNSMSTTALYFELNPLTAHALQTFCVQLNLTCRLIKDISGNMRFAKITR